MNKWILVLAALVGGCLAGCTVESLLYAVPNSVYQSAWDTVMAIVATM